MDSNLVELIKELKSASRKNDAPIWSKIAKNALKSNSNKKKINLRRSKRKNKRNNKFDMLKGNFYNKVQKAFEEIASKNKKDYIVFNSSNNDNYLEKKILSLVLKKIKYE